MVRHSLHRRQLLDIFTFVILWAYAAQSRARKCDEVEADAGEWPLN